MEDFSIGQTLVQIPEIVPERDLPAPSNLHAEASPMGITVTWDRPFGTTEFNVRHRPEGVLEWTTYPAKMNRTDTVLPKAGLQYEYQVQSCFGDRCGDWTEESAIAVSGRDTAPPPTNIKTRPTKLGFIVEWSPPQTDWNITSYEIRWTVSQGRES